MRKIELEGKRFNRLLVQTEVGRDKQGLVLWQCQCDCGNKKTVNSNRLNTGHVKSCGCLEKENQRARQFGDKNHQWKGGLQNKGSEAHALQLIRSSNQKATKAGHKPILMDAAELSSILLKHDGTCDICSLHEDECTRRHCIDHCHDTGKFRGFLCQKCNTAVGAIQDSPHLAWLLVRYLSK